MNHFTITELCRSATANARRIDNSPTPDIRQQLQFLIEEVLDPIREAWGGPITVNSGYRCAALNKAVGGVATSQHQKGEAADLSAGSPATNKMLFDKIVDMQKAGLIQFDQLIWEKGSASGPDWVHISYRHNRNQILHLSDHTSKN